MKANGNMDYDCSIKIKRSNKCSEHIAFFISFLELKRYSSQTQALWSKFITFIYKFTQNLPYPFFNKKMNFVFV